MKNRFPLNIVLFKRHNMLTVYDTHSNFRRNYLIILATNVLFNSYPGC